MSEVFSLRVGGFGLSDSQAGPESLINYDEATVDKFLHVHVEADLPQDITVLDGRYRKVTDGATGNPADDRDLGPSTKIREGEFAFVLEHYVLDESSTYLIRVADSFSGDTKCLGSSFLKKAGSGRSPDRFRESPE